MSASNLRSVTPTDEGVAAAIEAARALGRALGESSSFKQFEAAYEVFQADWSSDVCSSDLEWQNISTMPSLSGYLRAQEELTALLREVTGKISEEIGVDYGAACSPSGGCC